MVTFLASPLCVTPKADNLFIWSSADKLTAQRLAAVSTCVTLLMVALTLAGYKACLGRARADDPLVTADTLSRLVFGVAGLAIHRSSGDKEGHSFESNVTESASEASRVELLLHRSQNPVKERKFAVVALLPRLLVVVLA